MSRPALLVGLAVLLAASQSGCATGLFGGASRQPRDEALEACVQEVPAESVPYADAFSACMERRGWVYSGTSGPRR